MNTPWFHYPDNTWTYETATVIGAGIAGHQVARHLAKRGWRVTIIDRHPSYPEEASGNAAGIISPKITATPSLGEHFYTQCFNYVIQQFTDIPVLTPYLHPCGVLKLACKERDLTRWQKISERNFPKQLVRCVTAAEASKLANIPIHHPALFFPMAGWVEPDVFCEGLGFHHNIQYKLSSEAISLHYRNDNWEVWDSQQQIIALSEALIICSGQNFDFIPLQELPRMPVAGQTTLVSSGELGEQLNTVIDHEGYITPRKIQHNRYHLIGASYDAGSSSSEFEPESDQQNLQKQQSCLPELAAELEIASEHGHHAVRMTTPDRLPYVGAVPRLAQYEQDYADLQHGRHWKEYPPASYYPGLFMAAAFGSHGMTTAALCAETLACLINNEPLPFDTEIVNALHPARFWIRQLKRTGNIH